MEPVLVSRDDLEKNRTGDVLLPVFIDDSYVGVIDDPVVNVIEGDIPLDLKIVKSAVGVFFDRSQLAHAFSLSALEGDAMGTNVVLNVSLPRAAHVSQTTYVGQPGVIGSRAKIL
jgi:hypothetical protein